jgi:hypothetical protein
MGYDVDGRADLYSLGIMTYYLLCGGHIPFHDDDRREILSQQVNADPAKPSEKCPGNDIPEVVEAIVMKALSKEPEDRYDSIADFADALEQAVSELRDAGHFKEAAPTFADMLSLTSQATPVVPRQDTDTVPVSDLEQAAYMDPSDIPVASSSDAWSTGTSELPRIGPSERFMLVSPEADDELAGGELDLDFSGEMPHLQRRPSRRPGTDPLVIGLVVLVVIAALAVATWALLGNRANKATGVSDADAGAAEFVSDTDIDAAEVGSIDAAVDGTPEPPVDKPVKVSPAAKPRETPKKRAAPKPSEKRPPKTPAKPPSTPPKRL